jgi:hypothetical protein
MLRIAPTVGDGSIAGNRRRRARAMSESVVERSLLP